MSFYFQGNIINFYYRYDLKIFIEIVSKIHTEVLLVSVALFTCYLFLHFGVLFFQNIKV